MAEAKLRCVAATALFLCALKVCWPAAAAEPALFSLGLISDVQWADVDDGWNYARTTRRCFRGALVVLTRAVDWWRSQELVAVAQLGDLIDGRNVAAGQSESAMAAAMDQLRRLGVRVLHAVGNHDLYNFRRDQLAAQLYGADVYHGFHRGTPSDIYYAFVPHAGWRILVLDAFQESLIGWPEDDTRRARALNAIKAHNPNDVTVNGDWFAGLDGLERRWVPYNGALGAAQLKWLRGELRAARHAGERVLVLSHAILHPAACDGTTLAWDYAEALQEIHRAGCVVAVIAGHDHAGGYHRDEHGVHHLTLCSPLNDGVDGAAYGVLDAAADAIVLRSPQLFSLLPRRAEARLPRPTDAGGGAQAMRFAIKASPAGRRLRADAQRVGVRARLHLLFGGLNQRKMSTRARFRSSKSSLAAIDFTCPSHDESTQAMRDDATSERCCCRVRCRSVHNHQASKVRAPSEPCAAAVSVCNQLPNCTHISQGPNQWATLKTDPIWWHGAEGVELCRKLEAEYKKGSKRRRTEQLWAAHHCDEYTSGDRLSDANRKHKLIFDIGFHSGDDTLYFLEQGYDVIGIDANPAILREGTTRPTLREAAKSGRLRTVARGIVGDKQDKEKHLVFYVHRTVSEWSRFSEPPASERRNYRLIKVPVSTCDGLIQHYGVPYYMKIDIEGGDGACLSSLKVGRLPRYVSTEDPLQLDRLLKLGYCAFKMVSQALARRGGRQFSGGMPEDAPGRWGDAESVRNHPFFSRDHMHVRVDAQGRKFREEHDLHARRDGCASGEEAANFFGRDANYRPIEVPVLHTTEKRFA